MASEPADVELIREVLAGRVERFGILIRRYQRLVATAALRMGIPREEVEDVSSEVFYKVYRSLARYRPEHALSTWLYRITVNAALDHRRSTRHESRMEEISPTLSDGRPSLDRQAGDKERARLLHEALGRIPSHYRAPLVLAHIEGLPLEEIARALDLPEGTIKSRLFRARALLKEIIRRHYPALAPAGATEAPS
ncbi:MAG TPA: sigma-70 family RNA polymerase sigma factor [Candidatus Dormibacteraeota bacterium]|nr:sigma-70 family RNA polymerase sigma factor [Candidatus Dormibacteraeota bacterium]